MRRSLVASTLVALLSLPLALTFPVGQLVAVDGPLLYELFVPVRREAAQLAPVLVFLHGRGESGAWGITNAQSLPLQLLTNASFASALPFIVLVPQCPARCMQTGWTHDVLSQVTDLALAVAREHGGDSARLYLVGQSMGGQGAWLYAAQQSGVFAALAVVCGFVGSDVEAAAVAQRLASTPVAVFHSADDSVVPVFESDHMVRLLRQAGNAAVRYTRYETAPPPPLQEFGNLVGHGSYELAFRDASLYKWLQAHSCPVCAEPGAARWVDLSESAAKRRSGPRHDHARGAGAE